MPFHYLVEREGGTGKVIRTFVYGPSGVTEREPDAHGKIRRRFVFSKDSHEIFEYMGEKDERVRRSLRYGEGHATLSDGGRAGKVIRTYQFHPDGTEIRERDGTRFGRVVRTFVFDPRGVLEKEGEEFRETRMFVFETGRSLITEKIGGWYGTPGRIYECENVDPAIFSKPEAFLQFLFVTE